jgi:hypothetical protein
MKGFIRGAGIKETLRLGPVRDEDLRERMIRENFYNVEFKMPYAVAAKLAGDFYKLGFVTEEILEIAGLIRGWREKYRNMTPVDYSVLLEEAANAGIEGWNKLRDEYKWNVMNAEELWKDDISRSNDRLFKLDREINFVKVELISRMIEMMSR